MPSWKFVITVLFRLPGAGPTPGEQKQFVILYQTNRMLLCRASYSPQSEDMEGTSLLIIFEERYQVDPSIAAEFKEDISFPVGKGVALSTPEVTIGLTSCKAAVCSQSRHKGFLPFHWMHNSSRGTLMITFQVMRTQMFHLGDWPIACVHSSTVMSRSTLYQLLFEITGDFKKMDMSSSQVRCLVPKAYFLPLVHQMGTCGVNGEM